MIVVGASRERLVGQERLEHLHSASVSGAPSARASWYSAWGDPRVLALRPERVWRPDRLPVAGGECLVGRLHADHPSRKAPVRGARPDDIIRFAQTAPSEGSKMSIFPTKILLATDGSTEAQLAARTAVDLSQKTDSELHLIHVLDVVKVESLDGCTLPRSHRPGGSSYPLRPGGAPTACKAGGQGGADAEVERCSAGGTVAQSHLMMGEVDER